MEIPEKTVCQRLQTQTGEELFLLVHWWNAALFDVEAMNGLSAWKAQSCRCPDATDVGREVWIQKAHEAFGYSNCRTTFEFESVVDEGVREIRWYWPLRDAELRGMGRLRLASVDFAASLHGFLTSACAMSKCIGVMTAENSAAQQSIELDMQLLKQEVKEATHSRKTLYTRCAALFNEKKREIEEKDREIKELRERLSSSMDVVDPYSDETA